MAKLSYSMLRTAQACKHKRHLMYEKHLWKPYDAPALLGVLCHGYILSPLAGLKFEPDDYADQPAYSDALNARAIAIADKFHRIARPMERFVPVVLNGMKLVEERLEVRLEPPIGDFDVLVVKADAVLKDVETGYKWLVDLKGSYSKPPEDVQEYDLQAVMYQWGLAQLGLEIGNTMQWRVDLREYTKPMLTQRGTMSRASITCDWDTYRDALVENELDVAEYSDMQGRLARFFEPLEDYRPAWQVNALWDKVVVPAALEISNDTLHPRRFDVWTCGGRFPCPVRQECHNGLFDGRL